MPRPLSSLLCAHAYWQDLWPLTGAFWLTGPPGFQVVALFLLYSAHTLTGWVSGRLLGLSGWLAHQAF